MKANLTFTLLALFLCGHAFAAVLPKSEDELRADASHIFTGEVLFFKSKVKGEGEQLDRVYTIKVRVTKVEKGTRLKVGDEVNLKAWTIEKRPEGWAGLQGFDTIPGKGETITAFCVYENFEYKPFHPNGIKKH